ncbi:hypothetical protein [Acrocarpospora catenulata]|uniref:hypothetical protein n=1 Tax=Acrocarpospora catenulata TaxID=2836182 RepID=UPI001BDB648B|nr:hypothetical protein [Acrocarpospora catenulata]
MIDPVILLPGLTVTVRQYESAAAGLAVHAPDVTLTWEQWTDSARWGLVPDEETCRPYKAEFTLQEHPDLLRRVNLWYEPDLRGGGAPRPHSHPWPFTAHILSGGYTEHRYTLTGGDLEVVEAAHRPGDANELPRDLFHEVTDLHEPETLTLMVATAPGVRGGWGYLDPDTGRYTPAPPPSDAWRQAWRALNPHR